MFPTRLMVAILPTAMLMFSSQIGVAGYPSSVIGRTDLGIYFYYSSGYQSVSDASYPSSVVQGGNLSISNYHLENVGTTTVTTPTVEWYLTSERNYDATYYYLGTTTYSSLRPFSYCFPLPSTTLPVPLGAAPGMYYLSAFIRNDGGAGQTSFPFSNNFAFSRTKITVNATGSPDIRIEPLSLDFNDADNPPLFVEIDWMETATHSHKPSRAVINRIIDTFAREGFIINLDVSNAIPHQDVLAVALGGPSASSAIQAIRNQYFNHAQDSRYYYSIWCHDYSLNGGSTGSSGIADLPGGIHLVSLGSFPGQTGTLEHQVGTFVHEFGHNLGQRHGGADDANYTPNYISVMNYFYQLGGVGPTLLELGFANSSVGFNDFGYSHGTLPSLNESDLNENAGIGLGRAVDWNCNGGNTDKHVAQDLQDYFWCRSNQSLSVISDFDNWNDIVSSIRTGARSPHSVSETPAQPCISWNEYQNLRSFIAQLITQGQNVPVTAGSDKLLTPLHSFVVYNDGGSDLVVNAITPEVAASWITWLPTAPFTVQPGSSQTVTVSVDYSQAPIGQSTRRLLVSSNDSDETPYPGGVNINTSVTSQASGSLQVTISPAGAISAGAQWRVDGGGYQNSGVTLSNLSVGSHTVSFKSIPDWGTAGSQTVTINSNLTTVTSGTYLAISQTEDFNGDGKCDYVLYNGGTQQTKVWYLNNNIKIGEANGPAIPIGWKPVDVADFNGDGKPDYALFNSTSRRTAIWYLSGLTFTGSSYGPTIASGYEPVAAGDFNGDGKPDLLLYNSSTRTTALWYLNNNIQIGSAYGPTLAAGYVLGGLDDFNLDGYLDYALFNPTTRQTAIWYLSGPTRIGSLDGPVVASGYQLAGVADFDSDGKPDFLLYNPSTRQTALWYLNNNIFSHSLYGPILTAGYNLIAP